ncbi:MAG: hypothetical protein JOZ87_09620 [Chloroflexi bacterium]|nr:hypothetical protein [Chloroflexota bacterium]
MVGSHRMVLNPEAGRGVEIDPVRSVGVIEARPRRTGTPVIQELLLEEQGQIGGDLAELGPIVRAGCCHPVAGRIGRGAAGVVVVLIGVEDKDGVRLIDANLFELREELVESGVPLRQLLNVSRLTRGKCPTRFAARVSFTTGVAGVVDAQELRESCASAT